jgi:hypothetical protein
MTLNVLAKRLSRMSKDDFKRQNFEIWLIVQAVSWHQRYPLSYRDLEGIFADRGFESKNRAAFQSAPAHFNALYPQVGRAFKKGAQGSSSAWIGSARAPMILAAKRRPALQQGQSEVEVQSPSSAHQIPRSRRSG